MRLDHLLSKEFVPAPCGLGLEPSRSMWGGVLAGVWVGTKHAWPFASLGFCGLVGCVWWGVWVVVVFEAWHAIGVWGSAPCGLRRHLVCWLLWSWVGCGVGGLVVNCIVDASIFDLCEICPYAFVACGCFVCLFL